MHVLILLLHCAGDIWSENGISLFAVIVHFIDKDWILNTKLAICKGMGLNAHTGETIKEMTYEGLHSMGIGESVENVPSYIHTSTPAEGSNMLTRWIEFEGAGCVCHRENNCLGKAMLCEAITPLLKKIKGICAHFHRTDKVLSPVCFLVLLFMFVLVCNIYVLCNVGVQAFVRIGRFN